MTEVVPPQRYFDEVVGWATDALQADEVLLATTNGETTDFIRFTQGDVRQAGSIQQMTLSLDLISGRRHAEGTVMLSNDGGMDRLRVEQLVGRDGQTVYFTGHMDTPLERHLYRRAIRIVTPLLVILVILNGLGVFGD